MTCVYDFFRTDDFENEYSNPIDEMKTERDYFKNDIWSQVSSDFTTYIWDSDDAIIPVSSDTTCEVDGSRLDEADDWLQNNFGYYDSTDGIIILDYYGDGTYHGCAYVGGMDSDITDTTANSCLVDYGSKSYLPSYDTNGIGIRHYLGMEPGHLYGAEHPEDAAIDSTDEPDMMFNDEGPECADNGSANKVTAWYCSCADSEISETVNNRC